jgi:hypothetical protein
MPPTSKKPTGTQFSGQMPNGQKQFGLNPQAFDDLIRAHGIKMYHSRSIPCPNIRDIYANDHDPNCPLCVQQRVYYARKELTGAILGNSLAKQFLPNGTFDFDQATVVLPSKYTDGTELDAQVFDRLEVIGGITVRYYQRVEHSQTGVDRLHFPALSIDYVMGSDGATYQPGIDVIVTPSGELQWISARRPGYDTVLEKGRVYSVNYYTKPVLTIVNLPHQLRVTQTQTAEGAVQERFSQLAVVRKDFFPAQPGNSTGQSDVADPRDGQE